MNENAPRGGKEVGLVLWLDGCLIAAKGAPVFTGRRLLQSRAMRSGSCSHGPDMEARRRSAFAPLCGRPPL